VAATKFSDMTFRKRVPVELTENFWEQF